MRLYNTAHFLPHRSGVLSVYTYPSLLDQDLISHIVLSISFVSIGALPGLGIGDGNLGREERNGQNVFPPRRFLFLGIIDGTWKSSFTSGISDVYVCTLLAQGGDHGWAGLCCAFNRIRYQIN